MIGDQKDRGVGCINLLVRKQIHSGRARSEGDKPDFDGCKFCIFPDCLFSAAKAASTHWFLNLR
jgi:hypothetical protein